MTEAISILTFAIMVVCVLVGIALDSMKRETAKEFRRLMDLMSEHKLEMDRLTNRIFQLEMELDRYSRRNNPR